MFVQFVFEKNLSFTLQNFIDFNTSVSSEMLLSVMSTLHERLPCSQFYFRKHSIFKETEIMMAKKKVENPHSKNEILA